MEDADQDYGVRPYTEEEVLSMEDHINEVSFGVSMNFKVPITKVPVDPDDKYAGYTVPKALPEQIMITTGMKMNIPMGVTSERCIEYMRHKCITRVTYEYNNYEKTGRFNHYKGKGI